MPTLFLKCRKCGAEFPTPIALTEEGHRGSFMISGMSHTCPACGVVDEFYTADYFVHAQEAEDAAKGGVAVMSGDQAIVAKTELDSMVGRLAAYGVEGGPERATAPPTPPAETSG
jgi:hypothetical protein